MQKTTTENLGRLSIEEFKNTKKVPLVILLDNIRSLHNIGSVFRTSDAFSVQKIYLCGITACPPHREIHKTALGATESVDWEYVTSTKDLIPLLKKQGFKIVAVEQAQGSTLLQNYSWKQDNFCPLALVLGNEVEGVEQEVMNISDIAIEIPQMGTKHSLNVSVSAGVVIWELFKSYFEGNET